MIDVAPSPLAARADVVRGVTFSKGDAVAEPREGYTPVLRAGNIQGHLILDSDLVYIPEKMVSEKQRLRRGDIVMCTSSGSAEIVGKTAFADQDWSGSFGAFCAVVRPKSGKCDPRYLFHYLQSPKFRDWTRNSSGVGIKNIRKSELDSYEIPFPSPDEQRRIAAILDKADAIRRKREQALSLADDFLKSVFLEMFDLEEMEGVIEGAVSLAELVERVTVGHVGPSSKGISETGVPFLRTQNIGPSGISLDGVLFVSSEFSKSIKNSMLKTGDVVISRHVTDKIRSAIVPPDLEGANCANIIIVRPGADVPSSFVHALLQTNLAQSVLLSRQTGSAQRVVNTKAFQNWRFPKPILSSMKTFDAIFQKTQGTITLARSAAIAAENLLQSVSQLAFRGQL